MSKYIPADELLAEIERYKQGAAIARFDNAGENADYFQGKVDLCDDLTHIITSLQQEQQEQPELPGIEEPGIPGKDFIPVEWVDACEMYGKWKIVKHEQQEQPDNEDIDKVAQELYEHLYELKRRNNVPTNLYDKQEIIDLWKAGVEYAYNHPKQAPYEVELEKRWITITIRRYGKESMFLG